jgi:hypothetical protein
VYESDIASQPWHQRGTAIPAWVTGTETPQHVLSSLNPYLFHPLGGGLGRMYDVSLNGQRFLMIKESNAAAERPPSPRIILVQNWFEELKRLVPTK